MRGGGMNLYDYTRLTTADVVQFIETGEGVLVDVLVPEHYEARHIPGACNACVYEMVFLQTMSEVAPDKTKPVVLYGAGDKSLDSAAAADKLLRAGYDDIAIFPGGLEEWRENGHALAGEQPDEMEPPHPLVELEAKQYSLVPMESEIHWTGRNNNGNHFGTIGVKSGQFDATGNLAFSIVLDMTSIRNVDLDGDELQSVLEEHLASDDFFFTSLFPEATFTTSQVKMVEDGETTRPNGMLQGNLALRGLNSEIAFPVHIRTLDKGVLIIQGNLDIDRTEWGIIYGSSRFFKHLGYHVVYDFISIDFRLVLK